MNFRLSRLLRPVVYFWPKQGSSKMLANSILLFFAAQTLSLPITGNASIPYYTLEEHWLAPSLHPYFLNNPMNDYVNVRRLTPVLQDVGPTRLASMNANNIRIQIISHVPIPEVLSAPNLTALANDELAAAITASVAPHSWRGFCMLPMAIPSAAATELRRCVSKLEFVGALVDAHLPNGSFYDGPAYDVLWAEAVRLDVPIYLHPTYPFVSDVVDVGYGLYAPSVIGEYDVLSAGNLGTAAWGWHERTGLGFLRLYLGDVFERFPALQIVLGHMGELVPYYLSRVDTMLSGNRKLKFKDVYARNVYVTTSGIFSVDPMATLLRVTDNKRVMYSVDHPFAKNEIGAAFMAALRNSGLVSEEVFADIAYRNAERLLRLQRAQ